MYRTKPMQNEFENEYEYEGEGEFENEYEYEGEGEFENEYEYEGEGEFENEAFIGKIASLARQLAPRLKKLAPIGARVVGDAIAGPQFEYEMEDEFENEYEYKSEYEYEYETLPQPEALAEAFATMASKVQSEAEAEAYAGAIAARMLPFNSTSMKQVCPRLIKGSAALTKTLRKSPSTRPLVKTLPIILAKVGKILKQKNAQGKKMTLALAARVMAKVTAKVLGNPMTAASALMGSSRGDRKTALPARRQRKPVYR
jgi:hypothetical protein